MQFQAENQFWKQRSKHGRDKLFTTPELLWEAACEYFQWCDEHPIIKIDYKGGMAMRCEIPVDRPYSFSGICLYLDCGKNYWEQFSKATIDSDFSGIVTRIEEIIRNQKLEGAIAGIYNANIVARELGLADKKDHSGSFEIKQITGMEVL